MTMIERVARAILAAIPEEAFGWSVDEANNLITAPLEGNVEIMALARAAIEAMRSPMNKWPVIERADGGVMFRWDDDPLAYCWQDADQAKALIARITAALKDEQ